MLINLRNALMTGKRLPYYAEVEYLESTGTQYIDTGVSPTVYTTVGLDFNFLDTLAGDQVCAARTGTINSNRYFVYSSSLGGRAVLGNVTITMPGLVGARHTILFNDGSHDIYLDGSLVGNMRTSYVKSDDNRLLLFATSGYGPAATGISNSRVYSCEIYEAGDLVRDFIPVRRGAVGYLYDRVTRKLFGNAGTGNFVVGPDVSASNRGGGISANA